MTSETRLYKTFKKGRIGPYSGVKWPKRIGAWVEVKGPLVMCKNGIHVARGELELLNWVMQETYIVEVAGEQLDDGSNRLCVRRCRLVRRTPLDDRRLRLFAADCAERALRAANMDDAHLWDAVRIAREFAEGEATEDERAAAEAAARVAARVAARAAAWAAARAAARAAAWAAAGAAWAAARAAGAAGAAEREWQTQRLRWFIDGG